MNQLIELVFNLINTFLKLKNNGLSDFLIKVMDKYKSGIIYQPIGSPFEGLRSNYWILFLNAGSDTIWTHNYILPVLLQSCLIFLYSILFVFSFLVAVPVFSPILKRCRVYCDVSRLWRLFWQLRVLENLFWKNIGFLTDFLYLI